MIVRPTGRGASIAALGIAALVGAFAFGTQALVPLGVGMIALPVLALLLVTAARTGLEPTHGELARGLRAGDVVRVASGVRQRPRRPRLDGLVVVRTTPRVAGLGAIIEKRPGEELVRLDRGVWDLPGPLLEVHDPLGLARATRQGPAGASVVVPPKVIPLEPGFVLACAEGAGARRRPSVGTDLDRIREYRAGDPLSRVHWAQTAKRGRLQTKVLTGRTEAGTAIELALDARARCGEDPQAFEEAVAATASLAHAFLAAGASLSIELHGERGVCVVTTARRGAVDRLLADVRPGTPEQRRTRRGSVAEAPARVVVTTLADGPGNQPATGAGTTVLIDPGMDVGAHERVRGRARTITAPSAKALTTILGRTDGRARAA